MKLRNSITGTTNKSAFFKFSFIISWKIFQEIFSTSLSRDSWRWLHNTWVFVLLLMRWVIRSNSVISCFNLFYCKSLVCCRIVKIDFLFFLFCFFLVNSNWQAFVRWSEFLRFFWFWFRFGFKNRCAFINWRSFFTCFVISMEDIATLIIILHF